MPLTRLDNLISSKTGRYLYVSPDDFNASDALDNRGNSPTRPFLTIQRAFLETARYSYVPAGAGNNPDNDRFDQFTILLSPGNHYIDNRPGDADVSGIDPFNYNNGEWNDASILDLGNPNNILRKFNSVEGGCIIPRGTSLVGTDLRRTQVRPLYVPDPADKDVARTSIFQVTGGCYFWQFTILDGDDSANSPLYDSNDGIGKVYAHPYDTTNKPKPYFSHHKITNFVFARKADLGLLYQKVAKAFSSYQPQIAQPGEFAYRIQENRIVGPLTDSNQIQSITVNNVTVGTASYVKVTVNTKVPHLFFVGQYVAVTNVKINDKMNGVFYVQGISTTDNKQFYYYVDGTAAGLGLIDGQVISDVTTIGTSAAVQAEVDSVESASPYVFNVSIRSTWGICGIWADGSRASGFKSMVIAQYTGVSLQKDDRAFIRYDELTNTWNQASLEDAFATTPYHIDSSAYWKDDWRNFHVRASEDSFIQCVSIFAVGFADHFLMESGGDMSITNSNSNFGNTSLHTKGYKGYAFNQDKGGYITHIVPPQKLSVTTPTEESYYPFNIQLTKQISNPYRLYLNPSETDNPDNRPSSTISGYKLGGKSGEKIYCKLDAIGGEVGKQLKSALINPSGVKKWRATLSTLSPTVVGIDNKSLDASNLIVANKTFIQEEAFGYILQKYPYLQDRPYVNPNITGDTGRYRDASSLIKANRQEIIDTAYSQLAAAYPAFANPNVTKCKRDMGYIIDAIANDLYSGGNAYIVDATKAYFGAYASIASVARVTEPSGITYAVVTTSQPHNLKVGDTISISNCSVTGFNNSSAIVTSVTSSTTFRYVNGSVSLITTTATGTVTGPNNVPLTNGLVGEETQSVYSFNAVRDLCKLAINNQLQIKDTTITADPVTGSNTNINSCANVKSTIDTLASILTTAITAGNLDSLPVRNIGPWSTVSENSKCKRDIGYIVEAIASDLKTGGNQNVVNAAKAYYIGTSGVSPSTPLGSLNYIEQEKTETLAAYQYVRDLSIAAMRNWIFTKTGCSTTTNSGNITINSVVYQAGTIVNVGSTIGIVVGMKVVGLGIPPNTYVKDVVSSSQIQIGSAASRLDVGTAFLASSTQSNVTLKFGLVAAQSTISSASRTGSTATITTVKPHDFITGDIVDITCTSNSAFTKSAATVTVTGANTFTYSTTSSGSITLATQAGTIIESSYSTPAWSVATTPQTDLSVIKDTSYPECSNVASAISTYYDIIYTILNTANGINSVTINTGTALDTTALGKRATLFTLTEVGTSNNNPHTLETGTPVKLVPRALNSSVDPRVVRLPKGFAPDTKYYVIAPGRYTQPYDYSTGASATFNGSSGQVLMLATSVENANAGIYIYSSETSSVDPGVVIEVHQHVKDLNYDLMKYKTRLVSSTVFQTEGPHSFDLPLSSLTDDEVGLPQKVFFRIGSDISGSTLPPFDSSYAAGSLDKSVEYYVRYIKPTSSNPVTALNTQFTIHTSLSDAKNGTNPARFTPNFTPQFYTYCNKRRSVIKFDGQLTPKPIPVVISTVSRSNAAPKIATIITSTPHGLANGDLVTINCTSDSTFNATAVQVTVVNYNATTFSYTNDVGSPILTSISATGTITKVTTVTTSTPVSASSGGCWYLKTSANNNTLYDRFVLLSTTVSSDTYFERNADDRENSDKLYRLRYILPKDGNYREPINGFVLKIRTDDTRKLLPQKILLKPVNPANTSFANVSHNNERLGLTNDQQINGSAYNTANPSFTSTYDPYVDPKILTSSAKINCKIQSAKKVSVGSSDYLQLTVFDVGVDSTYKDSIFTVVKITTPQGGTGYFTPGSTISWSGNSSGSATLHACYTGSGSTFQNPNYLILRNPSATIQYSSSYITTFTQGTGTSTVSAALVESPDGGKSDKTQYLYTTDSAAIYTMVPGDVFTLPLTSGGTADYYIDSVTDVDDLQNTYYIFKSEAIRKRVKGQQDGIYYLTALRGDIKPYPTGSGIDENFRNFKFSQPVSRVYPLNYTNDPLWYQITDNVVNNEDPSRDTTLQDPPAAVSAADNYVHGYVTVNDARNSITKETINTLIVDPGTGNKVFSGTNTITAQEGSASAGAESRKIPISGSSDYPTESKLYIELRRPSIARSGNHTFEYLGFGPGNYSTSFPARQQIVLTDIQDYYSQAKREDAGIVLYTGLNSSGDLYIGNLKINAVTGEQTYLDAPITDEVDTEASIKGTLVTTFDDPVTFNNNVLFQKPPSATAAVVFTTPVLINTYSTSASGDVYAPSLVIQNNSTAASYINYDTYKNGSGDMIFANNIATFGVWRINPRGIQAYSIRTSDNNVLPKSSNAMVDLNGNTLSNFSGQNEITWGSPSPPKAGDIVIKGDTVEQSGSLGWILGNTLSQLTTTGASPQVISGKTFVGYAILRLSFGQTLGSLGINSASQFKITNYQSINSDINTTVSYWPVLTSLPAQVISADSAINGGSYSGISTSHTYIYLQITNPQASSQSLSFASVGNIYLLKNTWKEFGVIGSEALRTNTDKWGDFRLGINTIARAAHSAYTDSFISTQGQNTEVNPRANLDLVGTAFISGKTIRSFLTNTTTTKTESAEDNAFMVGGNSLVPSNAATLRVSTTNTGRVGINATLSQMDSSLTVIGNGRITGNFKFESDIEVNGGDITTTNSIFGLANENTLTTLSLGGYATTVNLFNLASGTQTINVGTAVTTSTFNLHTSASDSTVNIGNSPFITRSSISIGGATSNPSNSLFNVKNAITRLDGDLEVNGGDISSTASTVNLLSVSGYATVINFGTYSTTLNIGAISGITTIRNPLTINGTTRVNGNIILNGGYDNSSINVLRAQLGTTATFHSTGSLTNQNVTFFKFIDDIDGYTSITNIVTSTNTITLASGNKFNRNDIVRFNTTANGVTAGVDYYVVGNINSISFQISTQPDGLGTIVPLSGSPAGLQVTLKAHFVDNQGDRPLLGQYSVSAISNNTVYATGHQFIDGDLVKFSSTSGLTGVDANTEYYIRDVATNTFKLSLTSGGTAITISGAPSNVNIYPIVLYVNNSIGLQLYNYLLIDNEIVQVVTPPTLTNPYSMKIARGQFGTIPASHPDNTVFYRLDVTPNATYVYPNSVANDTINVVQLAEFGGSFSTNDYIKIDNEFLRITSVNTSTAKSLILNTGTVGDNSFTVASTTGNTYIRGTLQVDQSITLSGSGTPNTDLFTITNGASPNPLTTFQIDSATGNTFNLGTLTVNNSITLNGSATAGTEYFTITNGASTPTIKFQVDTQSGNTNIAGDVNVNTDKFNITAATGDTSVGRYLTVQGLSSATPSATQNVFSVRNLGVSGVNTFAIKQDGSVNSFGISNYFNKNGGRKWIYISTENNTDASVSALDNTILKSNVNYFVKPSGSDSALVLRLPSDAVTGDMIRFADVGGNLSYNCTLVVRAPIVNGNPVKIQGDSTGTRAGGLGTSYASGELLVNTPNAAFGLIYLGANDGDGNTVGSTQQGWWIMEI